VAVAKHHVLNAMIFREGAEYAVYINTAADYDASDSGAISKRQSPGAK
jgi:deoxyhypusine synthase